jgi:hypothetical protein
VTRRAAYRVRQFLHALFAPWVTEDLQEVRRALTPAQWALFLRMPAPDRRHGLAVFRALRAQGVACPDLLVAALLHDVGKAEAAPALWLRVLTVLLERFAPRLLERWAQEEGSRWQRALWLYRQHAVLGARQAAAAGCSSLTVALIRRHHEPGGEMTGEEEHLLALLQEADGRW